MRNRFLTVLLCATALTACDLSPDFMQPAVDVPASFKEVSPTDTSPIKDGSWAASNPAMAEQFGRDEWWRVFGDETLNELIATAHKESPTLEASRERLVQARAFTESEESRLYPDIIFGAGASRQKQSPANPNIPPGTATKPYTLYRSQVSVDYGIDIFGRARNMAFAALMREEGEEHTFRAAKITLEADIAESYYRLRALRSEEAVLRTSLGLRGETLGITKKRYEIGDVSDLDVARAEGEEATTKSDLYAVEQQRAVVEHTLALLVGKPPSSFDLETTEILAPPPAIPAGMPSTLLERRPDIARAAREMEATNAEIGVARGAFFPSIDLSGLAGFESASIGDLFNWSSRTWLLGPISGTFLTVPIFDGGQNSANLALAKSGFRLAVANYRAQVLVAFKETEDALSGIRNAKGQAQALEDAMKAADRAYNVTKLQYDNGFTGYLERIDAERSQLAAQRGVAQSRGNQYIATITLIRALGGGWDVTIPEAPKPKAPAAAPVEAPVKKTKPAEPKTLPAKEPVKRVAPAPKPAAEAAPVLEDASKPVPADTKVEWQTLDGKPAPVKPAPLPFGKRHPNKPVKGFEEVPPEMRDIDTDNSFVPSPGSV